LRSLHFAEVAEYFNTIKIPRGAYAARAMGERRWRALSDQQRELLERSTEVWEKALAAELLVANEAGFAAGRQQGIEFHDMPPDQQAAFDALYEHDGEVRARELVDFGIDGMPTYQLARSLAAQARTGADIQCRGDQT
jgi:hypothetical protein